MHYTQHLGMQKPNIDTFERNKRRIIFPNHCNATNPPGLKEYPICIKIKLTMDYDTIDYDTMDYDNSKKNIKQVAVAVYGGAGWPSM